MRDYRRPPTEPPALPVEEQLLSPQRAFVVQFRSRTDTDQELFVGRVEHVISGQAMRFESLAGLVAFFTRVLREAR